MSLSKVDRVFYNQNFTMGGEKKLYINNISSILHNSYKRTYDLMYDNNGILERNYHKEVLFFYKENENKIYQFYDCVIRILEVDRVVLTYSYYSEVDFNEEHPNYKELKNEIRKMKIDKILK